MFQLKVAGIMIYIFKCTNFTYDEQFL